MKDAPLSKIIQPAKDALGKGKAGLFVTLKATDPKSLADHTTKMMEGALAIWKEKEFFSDTMTLESMVTITSSEDHVIVMVNLDMPGFLEAVGDQFDSIIDFVSQFGIEASIRLATDMSMRGIVGKVEYS